MTTDTLGNAVAGATEAADAAEAAGAAGAAAVAAGAASARAGCSVSLTTDTRTAPYRPIGVVARPL
jgi:hypothetical protein